MYQLPISPRQMVLRLNLLFPSR
uniref:Uncharacterized protein n=1 Tax=Rhizophora mucronata TaxID=61149 RepID=A0A2P2QDP3_RHIMU